MQDQFKKKYSTIYIDATEQTDMIITTATRSKLDADFDDLFEDTDEVSMYLVERLAHKDTNVLNWWKVIIFFFF